MPDRQIEQEGIGQLVMSEDTSANLVANIRKSALEGMRQSNLSITHKFGREAGLPEE